MLPSISADPAARSGRAQPITLLGLPEVLMRRARSDASHRRDIKAGLFTPPIRLGGRGVAWPIHEVEQINRAVIAGASADHIRALVKRLVAVRAPTPGDPGATP